ncbi:MAG: hypothetical protein KJ000_35855, partial [Pirellulaceae bacterium]|nr:hypothetical protein [Pirellulaceae bacterium]
MEALEDRRLLAVLPVSDDLVLWLRADHVVVSGSTVTSWTDLTGAWNIGDRISHDATLSDGGPTIADNAVSGYPAVAFGGGGAYKYDGSLGLSDGFTAFIVGLDVNPAGGERALQIGEIASGANGKTVAMDVASGSGGAGTRYNNGNNLFTPAWNTSTYSVSMFSMAEGGRYDSSQYALNGTPGTFISSGSPASTVSFTGDNDKGYTLGRGVSNAGVSNDWLTGQIAEVLLYSGQLSSNDQNAVGYYLQQKYGLSGRYSAASTGVFFDDLDPANSNWSTLGNWDISAEPTAAENAYVGNGLTATVTQTGESAQNVTVGHNQTALPGTGTLTVTGGRLTTGTLLLGDGSDGTLNMSGGELSVSSIADGSATSTIHLRGGTLGSGDTPITVDNFHVNPATATANLTYTRSGGTLTINNDLKLGGHPDGGSNWRGNVTQTGGDVHVGGNLIFGGAAKTEGGTYHLRGGTLQVDGDIVEGAAGTPDESVDQAHVYVDVDAVTIPSAFVVGGDMYVQSFRLGQNAGSTGAWSLPAAQKLVNTGTMFVGNNGTGVLNVDDPTATLSEPTITVANSLRLGAGETANSGNGTLNFAQGVIDIDGGGLFLGGQDTNANKSNTVGTVVMGVSGETEHTKAQLFTAGANFEVGQAGTATVTQHSGTVTVQTDNLILGQAATATGTYTIHDGKLETLAGQVRVGNTGKGTFIQNGGQVTSQGVLDLGNVNNAASSGAYTMNGGTLTLNNNWYIGNLRRGVFDYNDGTINFGNILYVGGTNSSSANAAPNADGTLNIGTPTTAPTLATGQFEIGRHGKGVVNQVGGAVTVDGTYNLVISQYTNGNGTYNMQGGTLTLGSGSNGNLNFNAGTGLFHQTGGTVQFSGKNINLTNAASGNATYRLDGGILDLRNGDINPGAGTAAFTFTGGTLKDVDEFKLPLTQDGGILQIGSDSATADTMTVTGNYVQNAGTLEITLTNATTRDLLSVNGSASLAGSLSVVPSSGITFNPGNSVTILTATGGVSGAFTDLAQGDSLFVSGVPLEISYTANGNKDVTLTYDATPVIDADELGIGVDNQTVITRSGANVQVTVDGRLVLDTPLGNLTNLTINGQTGDDTLTVDYSNGSPIPSGGLSFDGGDNAGGSGAGDRLLIEGTFSTVMHQMTSGDSGSVALGGGVITYTGLEPVDLTGSTITDLVLNLPAGADNAELSDVGGETLRLRSTDNPVTFEQTDFMVPSGSVTIHAGSDDRVTVATAVDMGLTDLIIWSGAIHLDGGTLTAGDQRYFGPVVLGEDAVLTGTNVTFAGTVDSDATPRSLEINASGQTRFANHVGSTSPLASLTTDAAGNTVFSTSPNGVFTEGLQVNLPFDSVSNGITPDISGNGRDGRLVGDASIESGKIGNAMSLDGNGDWIRLDVPDGSYDGVTGTEARTMTAWVRTTSTGAGLLTWGTNTQGKKWAFRLDGGRLRIEVNGGFRVGTTVLNDGQWHHVALTLQGGSSPNVTDALLYVDGVAESTYTTQQLQAIDTASGTSVYIGADRVTANNNSRDFSGQIDEVGIWSRALSAAEIAYLAAAQTPGTITVTTSGRQAFGAPATAEVDVTLDGIGVRFDGRLDVNSRTITIVDPNPAVIADVSIGGGTLTADKGVSMSSGDVLSGAGTIVTASGELAVNSGRVAPGVGTGGTGILVTSDVDFGTGAAAGTFAVDLNGTAAGTGYDQLNVAGSVDLNPAVLEVSLGFVPAVGNTFTIITTTGGVTGTFQVDDGDTLKNLPEGAVFDVDGQTFTITYAGGSGGDVVLTARGVPETAVTLDGSGNLLITDINGGVSHDDLTIQSDVANNRFVIRDPNLVLTTNIPEATRVDVRTIWVPFHVVSGDSIIVDTLGGNDSLTVDFSLGDFTKTIRYDGGTQTGSPGDVLVLTGGTYGAIVFNYENLNDGDIDISGQGISYTGLEPILSNLNTDTVTLNHGPAGETIVVSDAGGSRTRVTSTAGEVTAFNNPTASLTINAGDGDDTIIVQSLAAGYASLIIDGQGSTAGDMITIAANLDLASLDITADDIVFGPVVSQPVGTTIFDFDILRDPDWTDARFPDMAGAVDNASRGFEFQLDSTVSHIATGASRLPGIDAAYVFPGNASGSTDSVRNKDGGQLSLIGSGTTSPQSRVPAPDLSSASFEIWFKPDDLTDKRVLWETGGSTGTALALDGNNLIFSVIQPGSGQLARVSYNLATDAQGLLGGQAATDEFIHAIGTFDRTGNGTSILYVNGQQVGTTTASSSITDWDGGDASGLGTVGGTNMGGFGSNSQGFRPFKGQIAIFRIYEGVLDGDQVAGNYNAVAGPLTISTIGVQTYQGAVRVTGNMQSDGTHVTFDSTVDANAAGGQPDLTVNTLGSGTTTFRGSVGAVYPLGSLSTNADGRAIISGGAIVTVGDQSYLGPVQVTGHTQLDAANVTFGSTVDASTAEIHPALTVNTTGDGATTFADAVGAIHPLASLTTNADGTTQLGSAAVMTTNLRLNYDAARDAIPGDNQWPELGTSGGRTWTMADSQSPTAVNDPKVPGITHAYQFPDARATTTSFYNVPSGANTNSATFELWFKPGSGSGNQMLFETGGSTNGMAIYYDATNHRVVVQAQTAGNSNVFRASASLADTGTGFQQVVGVLKPLPGGSGNGRIEIYLNGQFVAAAERNGFSDWAGSDGSGLGRINGASTQFSGGNFQGQIAILRYYNSALDASQIEANYRALTMQVVTSGDQTYGNSVVLTSDTRLAADGVTFQAAVDSDVSATTPLALAINASGDTGFLGNVGDIRPLASVATDAAGRVILAANITTSGDQTYLETAGLVLAGNAALTGTNIAFSGPIDDDGIEVTPSNLTVYVSDVASIFGPVGSSQPINSITTGGRGRTELSGGTIALNGDLATMFQNGLLLRDDLTITASGTGSVFFAAPVDSQLGSNHGLTVNALADTIFGDDVGRGLVQNSEPSGLGNLTTDAAGRTLFGLTLTATPLYAYDAAEPGSMPDVWVSTTATQNRDVTLSGVEWVDAVSERPGLSKAFRFDDSDTGTVATFNVLNGTPASTATVELWVKPAVASWADVPANSGQILFETGGITGWGVYLYRGASGDPVLRFRTGNSPERTTVDFALTDDSLLDDFMQIVTVTNPAQPAANQMQLYVNGRLVGNGGRSGNWESGGDDAGIGSGGGANLGGSGNGFTHDGVTYRTFQGDVALARLYRAAALTELEIAASFHSVAAVRITTTGNQRYRDEVILQSTSHLAGANVTFESALDDLAEPGTNSLIVDAAGTAAFLGPVGNVRPLLNLTTGSTGQTDFAGGSIITVGDQIYLNPVILTANMNLTVGGDLHFGSTMDDDSKQGDAHLTALVTGTTTLDGTVGTIAALTGLTLTTGGPLSIGVDVTARNAVKITVTDHVTTGDDLTVESGATIKSLAAAVELRAGDDLTLENCSSILVATAIRLQGDYSKNVDPDPGVGSTLRLLGTLLSSGEAYSIRVHGGADADTIWLNPGDGDAETEHTAGSIELDGGEGNDTYHIDLERLAGEAAAARVADSGGSDGDQAYVYGTSDGDLLTVRNHLEPLTGGVVRLATDEASGPQVNYTASLEVLTVAGGEGSDTFDVQPSQTTEIEIVGGLPTFGDPPHGVPSLDDEGNPTVPGDTLNFDSLGNRFEILCGRIDTEGGEPAFQLVRYFGIENLPLDSLEHPLGKSELHFDFNWTPAETQGGYTSVLPTTLYGVDGSTYGWNAVVNGFDRGAAMVPGTTFTDLLRDGHWQSASRTFTADVANGWYLVSVKTGDASFARNRLQVVDANKGTVLVERVDSAAGQFAHPTFVVLVERDQELAEGMGTLALTFSNLGGDPYWVINGLEIWPGKLLGIGSSEPEHPVADGLTEETVTGYGATPDSLVTVSAWLDATGSTIDVSDGEVTITSADQDPHLKGVQVRANESGAFAYSFVRPSAAGTLYVQFVEPTGQQSSCQAFRFVQANYRRFDFDGPAVDTQILPEDSSEPTDHFLSVRGGDLFTRLAGHGWSASVSEFERGAAGISEPQLDSLYRDGHWQSATRTFQVGVDPAKTYDVRIHTGDRSFARNQLQVTVEGAVQPLEATAANEFETITVLTVTPSVDGVLDIQIANLGGDPYWVINGIEVAESTTNVPPGLGLPALPAPPTPTPSAAMRFDFGTSSSPVDLPDFTGVGATNAFDPGLGYGWTSTASTFSRSGPNALLQDGHWGTSNTFNVNVANGTYLVNVTLGDASFARNNISVWAEGIEQHSGLATAAGQFIHRSFPVSVTDNQLNVRIASTGGDPYFTINSLEVF